MSNDMRKELKLTEEQFDRIVRQLADVAHDNLQAFDNEDAELHELSRAFIRASREVNLKRREIFRDLLAGTDCRFVSLDYELNITHILCSAICGRLYGKGEYSPHSWFGFQMMAVGSAMASLAFLSAAEMHSDLCEDGDVAYSVSAFDALLN